MSTTESAHRLLRQGWRDEPTKNRSQMTHLVEPGRTVALCGIQVRVIGDPWPDNGVATVMCRCATCANATYFIASGESYL